MLRAYYDLNLRVWGTGCRVFPLLLSPTWLNHENFFVHPLAVLNLWVGFPTFSTITGVCGAAGGRQPPTSKPPCISTDFLNVGQGCVSRNYSDYEVGNNSSVVSVLRVNIGFLSKCLPKNTLFFIEKRQLWVGPIEWLKLNFASCVVHQTRSLDVLILYFIHNMNMVFVN